MLGFAEGEVYTSLLPGHVMELHMPFISVLQILELTALMLLGFILVLWAMKGKKRNVRLRTIDKT